MIFWKPNIYAILKCYEKIDNLKFVAFENSFREMKQK